MKWSCLFSLALFSTSIAYGNNCEENLIEYLYELDVIKDYQNDLIELNVEKVLIYKNQVKLCLLDSWFVDLPKLNINQSGLFLDSEGLFLLCKSMTEEKKKSFDLCSKKETNPEAAKHYDEAKSHGLAFLGHSAGAAASLGLPPLAVIETYNAVQSLKKMADEYLKGWDIEHNNNTQSRSDWRDHEDNSQAGGSNSPYEQNR